MNGDSKSAGLPPLGGFDSPSRHHLNVPWIVYVFWKQSIRVFAKQIPLPILAIFSVSDMQESRHTPC
jgi:hypothetical protein